MHRRLRAVAVVVTLSLAVASTTAAAAPAAGRRASLPDTIDLPDGFAGEGVATGRPGIFYAGSRTDGRIARGDLRSGTSQVFVDVPLVPSATGLKADLRHGLLWVSGAATGHAAVYDLRTGAGIADLTLTTSPAFINDVVVTRDAAYFTNSQAAEIYRVPVSKRGRVGQPQTITLSGPAAGLADGFNLNGIDATADGRTLIAVNSTTGALFTIDRRTGASEEIDLDGDALTTGDGILLVGRLLLVVQNGNDGSTNQIAVVKLSRDLASGRIATTITSPLFETATTVARTGSTLLAVNAQFLPPPVDPGAEVVVLSRR